MIWNFLLKLFKRHDYEKEFGSHEIFYDRYYAKSSIPKDIPIRLRELLIRDTGRRAWWLKPEDCIVDDEIDFFELMLGIGEVFGVSIPDADIQQLDPSFDAVVRYLAAKVVR